MNTAFLEYFICIVWHTNDHIAICNSVVEFITFSSGGGSCSQLGRGGGGLGTLAQSIVWYSKTECPSLSRVKYFLMPISSRVYKQFDSACILEPILYIGSF